MAVKHAILLKNTYRDSVFLMKLSSQAKSESGAKQVSAMMGTPRNKELFAASGLDTPEVLAANPDDLVIAVEAEEDRIHTALERVHALLEEAPASPKAAGGESRPATLADALRRDKSLNLALISTAGDYARYEAAKALTAGMDVMLYSDNVSLRDEVALKKAAVKKGLLVMGPDCGTALINGVPLAFANVAGKGPVGIVGASGTGLQEVICLLDRMGVGVSNAYGTGGRDLKDDVGGLTAFAALDRLAADPLTKIIAVIGKPPGKNTRAKLAERFKTLGKPVFVHYLGAEDYALEEAAGAVSAPDLTEIAEKIAVFVNPALDPRKLLGADPEPPAPARGFVRGLFGGGTLCQESAEILGPLLSGAKYSNLKMEGFTGIHGAEKSKGHCFWDFGDDEFTVGRPHPMMAPDLKMERLVDELLDPETAVVLLDMVIGYGSHPDQASLFVKAVEEAAAKSNGASRGKVIIMSVCGTDKDNPGRADQVAVLREAGALVFGSNAHAARAAARALVQ